MACVQSKGVWGLLESLRLQPLSCQKMPVLAQQSHTRTAYVKAGNVERLLGRAGHRRTSVGEMPEFVQEMAAQ